MSVRLGIAYGTTGVSFVAETTMGTGFNIRFDENDDLVVDDIPDDLMADIEQLAKSNERSVEDEMRAILIEVSRSFPDSAPAV